MSGDDNTKQLPADDRLDRLISLVHQIASDVRSSSERLERLESRQERLDERLERLETKVDERLHDTRPMWEAIQTQMKDLRIDMLKGFRRIDNKIELYSKTMVDLYGDQRDLAARVDKLEEKAS